MGTSNLLIVLGVGTILSKSVMSALAGEPISDGTHLLVLGYSFVFVGIFARLIKWAQEESIRRGATAVETDKKKMKIGASPSPPSIYN